MLKQVNYFFFFKDQKTKSVVAYALFQMVIENKFVICNAGFKIFKIDVGIALQVFTYFI